MPDTEIVPFAYMDATVRVEIVDGEPRFVVADLAKILGYRDANTAARLLKDGHKGYAEVRTPGGVQTLLVANEKGLYRLLLRSNAANAELIQDWVTDVVLPEINQTGSYANRPPVADLDVNAIKQLHQAVSVLLEANERQAVEVAELTPRAIAWDAIASAEGDYSVGEAAKILVRAGVQNLGPTRLFQRLADLGWTYRGPESTWMAYADRIERGHLAHKPMFHYHPRTRERVVDPPQLRVTLKGIELLRQRLGATGPVLAAVTA